MILHRQGTQPRLIDSSEHSSINLVLSDPETTLFYQNYNFEKTNKIAENGFSRGVSRATEGFSFAETLPHCPIPLGPTQ